MTPPSHGAAVAALIAGDPDLARAVALAGLPLPRRRRPGFAALLQIIVEQQVSVAAGRAIWGRLQAGLGQVVPDAVLAASEDQLRGCGLSRPKLRYARALAEALGGGALDLDALDALPDGKAVAALSRVKGIGRWTAEIYLMFALGRPDLWPAHDIALAEGVARLKGLAARPDPAAMDRLAAPWAPLRSTAALIVWRYYGHLKQSPRLPAS